MVGFPNAKINIGLHVTSKRPDGYHNLESIFYPVNLTDALEIVKTDGHFSFTTSGIPIDGKAENNLCIKAFKIMQSQYNLTNVNMHLHKAIPFGAGLGGGSADAAWVIKMLNTAFDLNLDNKQLQEIALQLGSDCAFFIENIPSYVTGRGENIEAIDFSLKGRYIVLVKPDIYISTPEAYKGIVPISNRPSLPDLIRQPVEMWKDIIVNDFEIHLFMQHPMLSEIKHKLYEAGADYASMSGSGSAMFGLFRHEVSLKDSFHGMQVWCKEM